MGPKMGPKMEVKWRKMGLQQGSEFGVPMESQNRSYCSSNGYHFLAHLYPKVDPKKRSKKGSNI